MRHVSNENYDLLNFFCAEKKIYISCTHYAVPEASDESHYSHWGPWSPCSVTCGNGVQARSRKCKFDAVSFMKQNLCGGENSETLPCQETACPGKALIHYINIYMSMQFEYVTCADIINTEVEFSIICFYLFKCSSSPLSNEVCLKILA